MEKAKKTKVNKGTFKVYFKYTVATGILGVSFLMLWATILPTPDLNSFSNRKTEESTKIYDRTGEIVLFDFFENKRKRTVAYEEISSNIKNATIAAEDRNFYEHFGIRPVAIVRAVFVNIFSLGFNQGGSTITQQLVKNSLLTSEKTISRKLKEWILSIKLEGAYTKDEILNFYLNEIPYGGNIYGIGEATQFFFNKEPYETTIAESAYLASLPNAPTFFSPFGPNRDKLEDRKNNILNTMLELGMITEEEHKTAKAEEVIFASREDSSIVAPHFVFFVKEQLEKIFPGEDINTLGLNVTTTLDYDLQLKAEEIVRRYALENEEKFNASNAGSIVIDVKSGDILAMVGSRGFSDEDIDGAFNVTLAERQPGSAFKPFAYAEAFNKGYTPETFVFDVETQFQEGCKPDDFGNEEDEEETEEDDNCYSPQNYDNVFRGPISLRDALAQSVNIPAIKTLYLAGLRDTFNLSKNLGLTTLTDPNRYGLTLVLGGGEVKLIDITNAYTTFAREGVYKDHNAISRIITKDDKEIIPENPRSRKVLDENVARYINDILSDEDARAPAFGRNSSLYVPGYQVAAKTGTTNDYRDAWIIGYSSDVAVGNWAGNNDNSPMEKRVAGFIIAPMWNEVMREALKLHGDPQNRFRPAQTNISEFGKPILYGSWEGGESFDVDRISGGLATELTPQATIEKRYLYDPHTILHWVDPRNPLGSPPTDPNKVVQYELWEYGVRKWVEKNISEEVLGSGMPDFDDNVHTEQNRPTIKFNSPTNDSNLSTTNITVSVRVNSRYNIKEYKYYFNNKLIKTSTTNSTAVLPYSQIEDLIKYGDNKITVSVRDEVEHIVFENIEVRFR